MKTYPSILVAAVLALSSVSIVKAATVRIEGDINNPSTVLYVGDDPIRGGTNGVNNVTVSYEAFELTGKFPDGYYVEDKGGITAGFGCKQQSRTLAICGQGGMPRKVKADLKGGNDTFTAVPFVSDGIRVAQDPIMEVNGGNGNDTINGDNNNDLLTGGDGDDAMNGQAGNDTMNGGNGSDIINGNNDNDTLNGQAGDDILNGNENDDRILGGVGRDTISGNSGRDALFGEGGDDFISSEDNETDNISCGLGRDRVKVGRDALIDIASRDCEDLF